jgi:hypothetical protein
MNLCVLKTIILPRQARDKHRKVEKTLFVQVVFEIPIFFYVGRLLEWLGPDWTFAVAYFFHASRCYLYTLLEPETVWWVLAPEVLHGFCFSLMWSGAVEKAWQIAPTGWEATTQTILNTLYYSMAVRAAAAAAAGWWRVYPLTHR